MTVSFNVLGTVDQSDGAHVDLLQPLLDETSARIRVVVGELLLNLGQAQAEGRQAYLGPRAPGIPAWDRQS